MKIRFLSTLIICVSLIFSSCGKESKKIKDELSNTKEVIKNASKVADESENMQQNVVDLKSKTPLTKAQFESWLPKAVIDLPLTSSTVNTIVGVGSCSGSYRIGNKRVSVMVIDGAGERGASAVSSYMFSSTMEYNEDNDSRYTKTKVIDGIKVKETYHKSNGDYNVSTFYGNRFAVDIETKEVNYDEVEQIIKTLNLSELLDF